MWGMEHMPEFTEDEVNDLRSDEDREAGWEEDDDAYDWDR